MKSNKINIKWLSRLLWAVIIFFSAYYLYRAIHFRFVKEGLGPDFWNKQFWYVFHIAAAFAPLLLGPIQFWTWLRIRHMKWHRVLGKIYIIGSLIGGLSAFYLAITIKYPGSVVPLLFLSLLWLFMTVAAWVTIRNKNVQAHRLFMIRGYTLALSFIFLRILSDLVYKHDFLSFINESGVKDTTYEWMSWVLPLLIVEFWISWIPLLKSRKKINYH